MIKLSQKYKDIIKEHRHEVSLHAILECQEVLKSSMSAKVQYRNLNSILELSKILQCTYLPSDNSAIYKERKKLLIEYLYKVAEITIKEVWNEDRLIEYNNLLHMCADTVRDKYPRHFPYVEDCIGTTFSYPLQSIRGLGWYDLIILKKYLVKNKIVSASMFNFFILKLEARTSQLTLVEEMEFATLADLVEYLKIIFPRITLDNYRKYIRDWLSFRRKGRRVIIIYNKLEDYTRDFLIQEENV